MRTSLFSYSATWSALAAVGTADAGPAVAVVDPRPAVELIRTGSAVEIQGNQPDHGVPGRPTPTKR